jgi:hypothetical protein
VAAGVGGVLLVEDKPRDAQTALPSPTPQTTAIVPVEAPTPAPRAPVETPAPRPDMLVIRTGEAPCWVELRIASEKPVARLLQAGTTWEVPAGGREVELVLGDAGAASVEYMGEVRSPAGAPGAVARFRLTGGAAPKPER